MATANMIDSIVSKSRVTAAKVAKALEERIAIDLASLAMDELDWSPGDGSEVEAAAETAMLRAERRLAVQRERGQV